MQINGCEVELKMKADIMLLKKKKKKPLQYTIFPFKGNKSVSEADHQLLVTWILQKTVLYVSLKKKDWSLG